MNFLEERIVKDGVVKEGNVLKVDSFLNHQMDIKLLDQMGAEFKRRFAKKPINKILTIEASGIGIACVAAQHFDVPYLYYRENYYQEAFDLCRQMNQFILTEEQKLQKSLYEQRFQVTKERLEMYIKLKNAAQAQVQLNTLDNLASQAGDEKLSNNLLYTQAGYYYTFGQNEQGDAAFQKLINQYKEKKEYEKVNDCYRRIPRGSPAASRRPGCWIRR